MLCQSLLTFGYIIASELHDPGVNDNGEFESMIRNQMHLSPVKPVMGPVHTRVGIKMMSQRALYTLDDFPRTFALLCEEFQKDYRDIYTEKMVQNAQRLISTFRHIGHPIFWTIWGKRMWMRGAYSAIDRFHGARFGLPENLTFSQLTSRRYKFTAELYTTGKKIMAEVEPTSSIEKVHSIDSLHYSKFADRDAEGNEILYPMLKALGVNTVVVVGSFTDECIIATMIEGVDRYGFDMILIDDATTTSYQFSTPEIEESSLRVIAWNFAKILNTSSLVAWLEEKQGQLKKPLATEHHAFDVALTKSYLAPSNGPVLAVIGFAALVYSHHMNCRKSEFLLW